VQTEGGASVSEPFVVTDKVKRQFWEDGVVHLPQVLDPTWVDLVEAGVARNVRNPGPNAIRHYQGTPREFFDDYCNYDAIPEYQMLLRHSPIAGIVAEVLGTERLWLYYEQVFVKEPGEGSPRRTPWHQDITYWITGGTQLAGFWITLEDLPVEESLEFVRGSHRGPVYAGTAFDPDDETTPYLPGDAYERIPDIEADRDRYDIVAFPITRGDAVLFHPGMLHGGGASPYGRRRRTLSIRFFGDDVVYRPNERPAPKFPGTSALLEPGAPLRGPWFPQVHPIP
jgi:ectoine hydroxylase-related dioxygenase (phytanoyl-CoA dioxygenase family)